MQYNTKTYFTSPDRFSEIEYCARCTLKVVTVDAKCDFTFLDSSVRVGNNNKPTKRKYFAPSIGHSSGNDFEWSSTIVAYIL